MPLNRNVLPEYFCLDCYVDLIQTDVFIFALLQSAVKIEPHCCHPKLSLSWSLIRFHLLRGMSGV
jgi:hypothetical protein